MKTYWRILGFAHPIEKYAVPYFFYTLLYAVFNVLTFLLIMPIVNVLFNGQTAVTAKPQFEMSADYFQNYLNYQFLQFTGGQNDIMNTLIMLALTVVLVSFLSNLFRYLGQRTVENMKITTLQRVRDRMFDNVMNLHAGFFSNERKGDIISKISSDVQVVQYCVSSTLQVIFREPFLIITYVFAMLMISWQLTVFSVFFLPLAALVIGTIVKRLRKKATAAQETFGEMVSTLDESLTGVKIIKAYNATDYVKGKFHDINGLYSRIMRSIAMRQQMASPISEFLGIMAAGVMLIYGGSLVVGGSLTGGEFIAYIGIFTQISRPLRTFADSFANINQGIAAGERVFELMDAENAVTNKPDAIEMGDFKNEIEFRNVYFSYENKPVIEGVSFKVRKGETVALVGASGGGKSTIADLIPRFYDVRAGGIFIDGHDIRDYTIESLRANMGIVAQETILFNDTIENNIRMGKRNAEYEEIVEAARVANAENFILQTEQGYQTNIGDRGMKLSGGQRQRLSIARAVLKNPPILILDEATSALDTESEKLVQDALESLLEGRTSVVIAHRLSTIHNADRIFVIDRGRIVEQGTHDELMACNGTYRRLVEMQHMH